MPKDGELSRSSLRALEIFEAFRDARRPLSLTEIARLTNMPISTCHGVFKALEQRGFLYFDSARNAYPTRRLFILAEEINDHDPIISRLAPALMKMRDKVDETVILGIRHGDSVIYLLVLESSQAIRYSGKAGGRTSIHSSSIGKVILGAMQPDALDAWLRSAKLNKITEHTITSTTRLKADLFASKARGYYVTYGENVSEVMAVAAPLKIGTTTFGVAIAGPLQRLAKKEEVLGKTLVRELKAIEDSGQ
ncbi:MAG: IclR family transcriptional regulator [Georgfuchsia sp.]